MTILRGRVKGARIIQDIIIIQGGRIQVRTRASVLGSKELEATIADHCSIVAWSRRAVRADKTGCETASSLPWQSLNLAGAQIDQSEGVLKHKKRRFETFSDQSREGLPEGPQFGLEMALSRKPSRWLGPHSGHY